MARQTARPFGPQLRRKCLSLAKTCSMGFKSGESGQEEELGSCGADELTHDFASVAAEIIHHDDVAGTKRREEYALHVEAKAVAVDRALDKPWRLDPVMAQGRQEGHRLPAAVWNLGGEPAPRVAPIPARVP